MRRAVVVALTATVVTALLGTPVGAQPADELAATRAELDRAGRELSDVEAAVQRAGDAVAAADERSREVATELDRVRTDLAAAEVATEAADVAEREAAVRLQALGDQLETLTERHRTGRDRLQGQAVTAFKRGGAPTTELWFSGVVQADDWHEVAITHGTVARMLADQRAEVAADADLTLATVAANAGVADARRRAVTTARDAVAEHRRVADLVVAQERLVTAAGRERAERAEVLDEFASDAAARAVLVRDLDARVARLESAAIEAIVPVAEVPADGHASSRADGPTPSPADAPTPSPADDPTPSPADGPAPSWAAGLPAHGRPWAAEIDAAARATGLDGRLLAVLVWAESNFRPDAVSPAGALGLTQLMPGTARGLGIDPHDPSSNLVGGARYLAAQLDTFGRVDLALAAYNAGAGRVERAGGNVPDIVETQLYVARVLERYEALRTF